MYKYEARDVRNHDGEESKLELGIIMIEPIGSAGEKENVIRQGIRAVPRECSPE